MNVEKWRDAAELIALVAVVGSLGAVVVELQQTQASLQAQTYQDRAFDAIGWHTHIASNPDIVALGIFADTFDPSDLSPVDTERVKAILRAIMIDADNEHYQFQRGFLDEEFYFGDTVDTIALFAPRWRTLGFKESREDFRVEVERILAEAPDR